MSSQSATAFARDKAGAMNEGRKAARQAGRQALRPSGRDEDLLPAFHYPPAVGQPRPAILPPVRPWYPASQRRAGDPFSCCETAAAAGSKRSTSSSPSSSTAMYYRSSHWHNENVSLDCLRLSCSRISIEGSKRALSWKRRESAARSSPRNRRTELLDAFFGFGTRSEFHQVGT